MSSISPVYENNSSDNNRSCSVETMELSPKDNRFNIDNDNDNSSFKQTLDSTSKNNTSPKGNKNDSVETTQKTNNKAMTMNVDGKKEGIPQNHNKSSRDKIHQQRHSTNDNKMDEGKKTPTGTVGITGGGKGKKIQINCIQIRFPKNNNNNNINANDNKDAGRTNIQNNNNTSSSTVSSYDKCKDKMESNKSNSSKRSREGHKRERDEKSQRVSHRERHEKGSKNLTKQDEKIGGKRSHRVTPIPISVNSPRITATATPNSSSSCRVNTISANPGLKRQRILIIMQPNPYYYRPQCHHCCHQHHHHHHHQHLSCYSSCRPSSSCASSTSRFQKPCPREDEEGRNASVKKTIETNKSKRSESPVRKLSTSIKPTGIDAKNHTVPSNMGFSAAFPTPPHQSISIHGNNTSLEGQQDGNRRVDITEMQQQINKVESYDNNPSEKTPVAESKESLKKERTSRFSPVYNSSSKLDDSVKKRKKSRFSSASSTDSSSSYSSSSSIDESNISTSTTTTKHDHHQCSQNKRRTKGRRQGLLHFSTNKKSRNSDKKEERRHHRHHHHHH